MNLGSKVLVLSFSSGHLEAVFFCNSKNIALINIPIY